MDKEINAAIIMDNVTDTMVIQSTVNDSYYGYHR